MLLAAPPASAQVALEAAVACFEALDYDCAEEKLLVAWGKGEMDATDQIRARLLEAQLALAQRDEPRARRAVRALLSVDPAYPAEARLPPRLRELIEAERPPPPAFFRPAARADLTTWRLFSQDGERWSDGLGVEAGVGGVFVDRWGVELGFTYSDHVPRTYELSGLTLMGAFAGGQVRLPAGFLVFSPGLQLGALHVEADGVVGSESYWGFDGTTYLEVSAELWEGLGLGGRVGLKLLAVAEGERAAFSWILPLEMGLRYAF